MLKMYYLLFFLLESLVFMIWFDLGYGIFLIGKERDFLYMIYVVIFFFLVLYEVLLFCIRLLLLVLMKL